MAKLASTRLSNTKLCEPLASMRALMLSSSQVEYDVGLPCDMVLRGPSIGDPNAPAFVERL
eukprot:3323027-Alexandrium_andersonii.AAC.1